MRIAMLTNNYKPFVGGVPLSVERLAAGLRRRGNRVDVFAPRYGEEGEEPGVLRFRSLKRPMPSGMVLPDILDGEIERSFACGNYDIIHSHQPVLMGYAALYLGRKYRTPVAFTYHTQYDKCLHYIKPWQGRSGGGEGEGLLSRTGSRLVRMHCRMYTNACDLVFAPSTMIRRELTDIGIRRPVEILPTGLLPRDFRREEGAAAAIRKRYGGAGVPLFCTVSRLEPEKNIGFLLGGLARLRGLLPDFRMLIIGEGSQRQSLEAQAAQLGLTDKVHFLGLLEHGELSAHYQACDMFLFASQTETQGIVLLEAMAAGLPVAALAGGGIGDILQEGVNGAYMPGEEGAWAARAAALWADKQRLADMGRQALRTALPYTQDIVAARAEKSYEAMLDRGLARSYAYRLG